MSEQQVSHPKIEIFIQSEYLENQSAPDDNYYAFSYHVQIQNSSSEVVQLLNRQWMIMDASGQVREVKGDGVIGEQPVIQPGKSHFYSSWSVIATPVGCMQGKYGMRIIEDENTNTNVDFYADIPIFTLAVPGTLN